MRGDLANIHSLGSDLGHLFINDKVPDALLLPRRHPRPKLVHPLLHFTFVWLDMVPEHLSPVRSDHAHIHVRTRAQVVEDTSGYRRPYEVDRFLALDM